MQTLQSATDSSVFIDLATWEDTTQCHLAQSEVESHPLFGEFASYFDAEKEMIMQFFKQVR